MKIYISIIKLLIKHIKIENMINRIEKKNFKFATAYYFVTEGFLGFLSLDVFSSTLNFIISLTKSKGMGLFIGNCIAPFDVLYSLNASLKNIIGDAVGYNPIWFLAAANHNNIPFSL